MNEEYRIMIRGAGDIATGTIHRLFRSGFRPIVLEISEPSAIRRQVSMCEAVYDGEKTVEGVKARLAEDLKAASAIAAAGEVPVIVDPEGRSVEEYRPDVLIDAILAKRNCGTSRDMAPLTVALGPGFTAGTDCDYVIETMRGHDLARIISQGPPKPNTGSPGAIAGITDDRVIHSPAAGRIEHIYHIGDTVDRGTVIARVHSAESHSEVPVYASITGLIRGLIREGYTVHEGMKIADIDPRETEFDNCFTISDKARSIAGSVLELVCADYMKRHI